MSFSGNAFEHWEHQVLNGEIIGMNWLILANSVFKRPTAAESKEALDTWAHRRGIRLVWKDIKGLDGMPGHEVHFLLPR